MPAGSAPAQATDSVLSARLTLTCMDPLAWPYAHPDTGLLIRCVRNVMAAQLARDPGRRVPPAGQKPF